jgi:2-polyprenyl-3-methyl-5-hydroxy-6-metoxy-1,4-benzoquinol methylase
MAETARVGACCDPGDYEEIFGARFSSRLARRYRRRGLDKTARRILEWLTERGVQGVSVLEIGGGVGDLQIELLRRGARQVTNLELVDAYEGDARSLAEEAGVADRIVRRRADLAATPGAAGPADVVILHRVVCCYPDYQRLLTVAADHATRVLVYSHPTRNWAVRVITAAENIFFRVRRTPFRNYVHDPDDMEEVARRDGFEANHVHRGLLWSIVAVTASPT